MSAPTSATLRLLLLLLCFAASAACPSSAVDVAFAAGATAVPLLLRIVVAVDYEAERLLRNSFKNKSSTAQNIQGFSRVGSNLAGRVGSGRVS